MILYLGLWSVVVAFFFFLVVGLASPQVSAETVAKLHGVKSYVETKGSTALASGVFSATLQTCLYRNARFIGVLVISVVTKQA